MSRKRSYSRLEDPSIKRDIAYVRTALKMQAEEELASPTLRIADGEMEPKALIKHDGALDRILRCAVEEFSQTRDSSSGREALVAWLNHFGIYLDLHLPVSARDLYAGPLAYLAVALSDLSRGFVRGPLAPAPINHRPTEGYIEINFRVACVLAADELFEAGRLPGQKRSRVSRQEADEKIFKRVAKAAAARELSMSKATIEGWRRAIGKASADDPMAVGYRTYKNLMRNVRDTQGSEFIVHWYLGRITDPHYIA